MKNEFEAGAAKRPARESARQRIRLLVFAEELFAIFNEADETTTAEPARPTKNITSSSRIAKTASSIARL
jgi:hypothetical protein